MKLKHVRLRSCGDLGRGLMQKWWAHEARLARTHEFPIACVPSSIPRVVSVTTKDERVQKRAVAKKIQLFVTFQFGTKRRFAMNFRGRLFWNGHATLTTDVTEERKRLMSPLR
jgi:hypothetical protein